MNLRELYNFVENNAILFFEDKDAIVKLKRNVIDIWGDIASNEIWFEKSFSSPNPDFIFRSIDLDKVAAYSLQNKFNNVFGCAWEKIEKIIHESKKDIISVSVEYDYVQYMKQYPVPCIFFEIDNDHGERNMAVSSSNVIKNICKIYDIDAKAILEKIQILFDFGISIWQVGLMFSRLSDSYYIRLFTAPVQVENRLAFLQLMGTDEICNNVYDSYYKEILERDDVEILYDFDMSAVGTVSNISIDTYYKNFTELKKVLSVVLTETGLKQLCDDAIKWQRRRMYISDKETRMVLCHIAHFKTKTETIQNFKIYLRARCE